MTRFDVGSLLIRLTVSEEMSYEPTEGCVKKERMRLEAWPSLRIGFSPKNGESGAVRWEHWSCTRASPGTEEFGRRKGAEELRALSAGPLCGLRTVGHAME